jgi:outer membrane protein assembly factor BamB
VVVAVAGSRIRAFSLETGAVRWSERVGRYGRGDYYGLASSPAISHGTVYAGSDDGRLYAFGLR